MNIADRKWDVAMALRKLSYYVPDSKLEEFLKATEDIKKIALELIEIEAKYEELIKGDDLK